MRRLWWLLVLLGLAACAVGVPATTSSSGTPSSAPPSASAQATPVSKARCNNNEPPYLPAETQTATGTDTLDVAKCQIVGAPDRDTRWILDKTVVVRIASLAPNGLPLPSGTLWLRQDTVSGTAITPHLSTGDGVTVSDSWAGSPASCTFTIKPAKGTLTVEASSGLLTFSDPTTTATVNWNC